LVRTSAVKAVLHHPKIPNLTVSLTLALRRPDPKDTDASMAKRYTVLRMGVLRVTRRSRRKAEKKKKGEASPGPPIV